MRIIDGEEWWTMEEARQELEMAFNTISQFAQNHNIRKMKLTDATVDKKYVHLSKNDIYKWLAKKYNKPMKIK